MKSQGSHIAQVVRMKVAPAVQIVGNYNMLIHRLLRIPPIPDDLPISSSFHVVNSNNFGR